jgi:predicted ATPase/DNA-binding NarL/FixJ family response regulator/Tfp pilus assembly protein PilF
MTVGNLPAESNPFIGRERDLVDLDGILDRARMLTLCGPGGIGKTRLAIRLGTRLAGRYLDGAWVADLAAAESPEQLAPLVCASLGVHAEPDRPLADTLAEALRPRTMLLILDTCEHLIAESASLTEWLLGHCPGLQVIATSTEPLRARGEVIWRVPPLGLPAPAENAPGGEPALAVVAISDAVRLFVARAVAARPGFELTPGNYAAVAAICETLDGVPLAIELAAARLRTLSVEQIRQRLVSRFELLAVGDRTAPRRQQTLRATVEWSYDLLSKPERLLLSRLSVFHGWSLEMAEQVCGDQQIPQAEVLDLLTALIDKSLVTVDYELDGDARYRLLDTVRHFAGEQADAAEVSKMREAHRDCMIALVESMIGSAVLRDDVPWAERVRTYRQATADFTNFRLALDYCAERDDAEQGLRLCNAMRIAWLVTGDLRGSAWLDKFLSSPAPVSAGVRSHSLVVRAEIAYEQQDYQAMGDYALKALSLARAVPDGNLAGAERMMALAALTSGRPDEALAHADAAVAAARKLGNSWEGGVAYAVRAGVLVYTGEAAAAEHAYQHALETLSESRGWAVANVLYGRGRLAWSAGDPASASRYFTGALARYRDVDARVEMARCLAGIGQLALQRHDIAAASESLTECVELSLLTGQRPAIARSLAALAAVMVAAGELAGAVRLAGAALPVFEVLGARNGSAVSRLNDLVARATATLGTDAVVAAIAEARQQSPDQVATQAMAWLRRKYGQDDADGQADAQAADQARASREQSAQSAPRPAGTEGGQASWPGPLTGREREVAMLVAQGWSNREIGEELSITLPTASRHIANIYRKLGFTSRAQLTAWVLNSNPRDLPAWLAT